MEKFQFQEGGLPLTIEYLQAIEKRFEALEKIAQFLTPAGHILFPDDASGKYRGGLRLSGMELTQDEDNNTIQISAGYVLINGEIVEVKASGILPAGEGEKLWLHTVVENTPATYKDGSTKPFEVKKYFTIDKIQSEGAIEFNPFTFAIDNAKEFRLIAKSKIESIDSKFNNVDADIEATNNTITQTSSYLAQQLTNTNNQVNTLSNTVSGKVSKSEIEIKTYNGTASAASKQDSYLKYFDLEAGTWILILSTNRASSSTDMHGNFIKKGTTFGSSSLVTSIMRSSGDVNGGGILNATILTTEAARFWVGVYNYSSSSVNFNYNIKAIKLKD